MDLLSGMRVFVSIADNGSLAKAGRELSLSPSVVSKNISALEDRLGARLLNRTTRSVSLTEVGIAYLDRARRIIGDVDEADDLISTFKQLNKTVATAKAAEKTAQKKAVRAAAVGGPRGNADAASSKRVYRRADIRQLMQSDPDRYEALQPEIMAAYAEGRVRD